MSINISEQENNRKTLIDWVRVTGLNITKKISYDQILQDFATKIVEYPFDCPSPFSWPVQAGRTNTGPAIRARMTYDFWEKTKKVEDQESLSLYIRRQLKESLSKSDQPIKPTVAAVKLNIDMSNWKGPSLEEMLSDKERNDIETGQFVYGSMKLISNKANSRDKVTKDNNAEKSASL
ncbi:hypothetical protein Q1695_012177 [Nippostrongylus brasiliensis]|nr:hypothetical protein Q1695_012177 [Nippostrongylus brasiliensis]